MLGQDWPDMEQDWLAPNKCWVPLSCWLEIKAWQVEAHDWLVGLGDSWAEQDLAVSWGTATQQQGGRRP